MRGVLSELASTDSICLGTRFSYKARSAMPSGTEDLVVFAVTRRLVGGAGGATYELGALAVILRFVGATGALTEGRLFFDLIRVATEPLP